MIWTLMTLPVSLLPHRCIDHSISSLDLISWTWVRLSPLQNISWPTLMRHFYLSRQKIANGRLKYNRQSSRPGGTMILGKYQTTNAPEPRCLKTFYSVNHTSNEVHKKLNYRRHSARRRSLRRSRSFKVILIPIESPYATLYCRILLIYILSSTVF